MSENTAITHYQIVDGIATITMTSKPVNALDLTMRRTLTEHLQSADGDDHVKAIVITSNLPLFCGGADIVEFQTERLWEKPDLPDLCVTIETSKKPIIAAIAGPAMGGALEDRACL